MLLKLIFSTKIFLRTRYAKWLSFWAGLNVLKRVVCFVKKLKRIYICSMIEVLPCSWCIVLTHLVRNVWILFRNSWGILFPQVSASHVRSPLIVAEYAPSMFTCEPSKRVLMMNISNSNMIVATYSHGYKDYVHYILRWILIWQYMAKNNFTQLGKQHKCV